MRVPPTTRPRGGGRPAPAGLLLALACGLTLGFGPGPLRAQPVTSAERRLVLVNRHLATVREAYVSPSREQDWGPDRLGSATLAQGEETALQVPADCTADIRIVFPNGGAEERRALDICANARVVLAPGWTIELVEDTPQDAPDAPAGGGLRLRNAGELPIVELYLATPGGPRGEDLLGPSVLPIGEAVDLPGLEDGGCTGDLTVLFRDGREVTQPGIELCQGEEIEVQ